MEIQKIFDLHDKVIVITGASGMLGTQYAYGLSECGAHVVLSDIDISQSKITEKQIKKKFSTKPMSIKLDLTNKESILSMTNSILKKYSKIDVLINNAAYQGNSKIRSSGFENLELETWNQAIDVNGCFFVLSKYWQTNG